MRAAPADLVHLPPAAWEEYRALRLQALQDDPAAFGMSYEESLAQPVENWRRSLAEVEAGESHLLFARLPVPTGELVGMMGAFFARHTKSRHLATIWGAYVSPSARGRGIGTQLMQALLDELRGGRKGSPGPIEKVALMVNPTQAAAVALYTRAGLEIVGRARRELKVGDQYHDLLYMEKFL